MKIGSSTVADGSGAVKRGYLSALARQLSSVRDLGWSPIVVSSGAIACGYPLMGLHEKPHDIPGLQAAASVGQGTLARAYSEVFGEAGMLSSLVLLTRHDTSRRSAYLHARDALLRLVDYGVVPIVNENDTTSVEEIRFGDNDTLSAVVACLVKADLCVNFSDVDGLFTADPSTHDDAVRLPVVHRVTEEVMHAAQGSSSKMGTGGMATKIKAARVLMVAGIPMVVCNGSDPGVLVRIVAGGQAGTRFEAAAKPHEITNYKLWIALGDTPRGSLIVDDGARDALVSGGKSLLCVGVVKAAGPFEAGDIVDIKNQQRHIFARGKVNASHDEVELARGYSTKEMAANRLLAPMAVHPLVHRDELVVFE